MWSACLTPEGDLRKAAVVGPADALVTRVVILVRRVVGRRKARRRARREMRRGKWGMSDSALRGENGY